MAMNQNTVKRTVFAASPALALCLALSPDAPAHAQQQQPHNAAGASAPANPVAAAFEARVKEYVDLREGIEDKMEKLPKDATPEQIESHKAAFQGLVRQARAGALPGQFFTRQAAAHVRSVIAAEFKGRKRAELLKTVAEAETKGVPLRVNYPYPESKELLDMPPTLLLKLPTLPKQVKYRFVGRNLLLVDRENGLILDYMTNALP
jgi:ABC-type transporter MlaC component